MRYLLATLIILTTALAGCNKYQVLYPTRNIAAGDVIQERDLKPGTFRVIEIGRHKDYAVDRSRVVGHKALRPIGGANRFLMSDVSADPQ